MTTPTLPDIASALSMPAQARPPMGLSPGMMQTGAVMRFSSSGEAPMIG